MRIASLLPSATEIVCSLGMEEELVAVTHECDYPESVRAKPVLTRSVLSGTSSEIDRHIREVVHQGSSIYALDADLLAALQPDVILTQELCEVCAVSYPIVERAARRLGRHDAAEVVCDSLRRRIATVEQRIAGRPRRTVVCLEWVDPPFNCGHWTPELVSIAGGDELLGVARQPAHAVDWPQVIDAAPQVVVIMACGFSLERSLREVEAARGRFDALRGDIWVVDGNAFFSRPGPRLVDSVEIMAGILHPGAVDPPPPVTARRLERASAPRS